MNNLDSKLRWLFHEELEQLKARNKQLEEVLKVAVEDLNKNIHATSLRQVKIGSMEAIIKINEVLKGE